MPLSLRAARSRQAVLTPVAAAMALLLVNHAEGVAAGDDDREAVCSDRTLRGNYGILLSGSAPGGPHGEVEPIIGTVLRTYDGRGGFTQTDNAHGQNSGAVKGRVPKGSYHVNPDCTGIVDLFVPELPVPLEVSIVIVNGGRQVKEAVMSPQPAMVAGIQDRVR